MNNLMRHILMLCGIMGFALVFYLGTIFGWNYVLYKIVEPPAGSRLEDWLAEFDRLGGVSVGIASVCAVIWYIAGARFRVNDWRSADKRPLWILGFLFSAAVAVAYGVYETPAANLARYLAYFFYFLNAVGTYYLATALFSPSAFKYIPAGAQMLRRW